MEKTTTLKVQVQVGVNDLHSFCKFSWEVENDEYSVFWSTITTSLLVKKLC